MIQRLSSGAHGGSNTMDFPGALEHGRERAGRALLEADAEDVPHNGAHTSLMRDS
jgi:hypothetical protein